MRRSAIGILVLVVLTLVGRSTAQDSAFDLKGADVASAERNYDVARSLYERAIREGASLDNDLPHARNLVTTYLNANPPGDCEDHSMAASGRETRSAGRRIAFAVMQTVDEHGRHRRRRSAIPAARGEASLCRRKRACSGLRLRQDGKSDAALRLLKDTVDHYPNLNTVRVEYARARNL